MSGSTPGAAGPPPVPASWPERARQALAELPNGSSELAAAHLARGFEAADQSSRCWSALVAAAQEHLVAPLLLEPDWPEPSPPLPVAGGFVHADLTDEDHELFARLRGVVADENGELDAESLAVSAQEWRLPVTPYRRHPPSDQPPQRSGRESDLPVVTSPFSALRPGDSRGAQRRPGGGDQPLVIDLSSLWAGPLAASLLAGLGARVVKIDAEARPDGLRDHGSMYGRLNEMKEIIDLDLRVAGDRGHFEELLSAADLLISSFSRRVMPNFGYDSTTLHHRFPRLATLSIAAFADDSPERDWVSYGPGVHAASGLAEQETGTGFRAAPVAYPDAIAGLEAFSIAAEILSGRAERDRAEVSLSAAIAPLSSPHGEPRLFQDQD